MISRTEVINDALTIEKADEAKAKVQRFMEKVLPRLDREGDKTVEVYQLGSGMEDPIAAFSFGLGDTPEEIATEIMNEASDDAMGIGAGEIRYVVRVDGFQARCSFTLRVRPEGDGDEDEFLDDLPNSKGITAQQMRHNEKLLKSNLSLAKEIKDMALGVLKQKDERISMLEGSHLSTVKMFEELASAKHVRDLEIRKLEAKERRGEQVAHMLIGMAPMLLGTVANQFGAKGTMPQMPAQTSPIESAVEGFLGTLRPDQLQALVQSGILQPEQIMGLIDIAKAVEAKKEVQGTQNPPSSGNAPPEQLKGDNPSPG